MAKEITEKDLLKSQTLVVYADKGLSQIVGISDKRKLRSLREFSFTWNRKKFARFPYHIDLNSGNGVMFYVVAEVAEWYRKYSILCDDMRDYGEPKISKSFFV